MPPEPSIGARYEIPSRNVTLNMVIKRNVDPALPASHLIELNFETGADFAGGSVSDIQRFVMKPAEQEQGEPLFAVAAKIAENSFLIALNNLPEARQRNGELISTRDWIDIPLAYRTGRRALVTIEKGTTGQKVFEQVLADWAAKLN